MQLRSLQEKCDLQNVTNALMAEKDKITSKIKRRNKK